MRHIDLGTLRRLLDEPLSASADTRRHLQSCGQCQAQTEELRQDQLLVSSVMGEAALPANLPAALAGVRNRTDAAESGRRLIGPMSRPSLSTHRRFWAATVAGLVALVALPVAAFGFNAVTIFQPAQLTAISVSPGELRTLPDLNRFGTLNVPNDLSTTQMATLAEAESAFGGPIATPHFFPSGVPRTASYSIMPAETSSFTFNALKAQHEASRLHEHLAPMPATINGTTLRLNTGAASLIMYGSAQEIPALVVVQTPAPKLTSTGASLKTLEAYVLHLPGVSSALAGQIESLGNPTSTLPIPVPINWAVAQHVTVNGSPGLLVGDSTGILSGVIWESHGMIHGVAGSMTGNDIVSVASSVR